MHLSRHIGKDKAKMNRIAKIKETHIDKDRFTRLLAEIKFEPGHSAKVDVLAHAFKSVSETQQKMDKYGKGPP